MNREKEDVVHAIGFQSSVLKNCFKKIITIEGRASRLEFWLFLCIILTISLLFLPIEYLISLCEKEHTVRFICIRVLSILFLPICIRRLHDIGKTGWTIALDWITPVFITSSIYFLSNSIAIILVSIFILTKIFVWAIRRFHSIENVRWPFFMIDLMIHLSLFAFVFWAKTVAINVQETILWAVIVIIIRALTLLVRDSDPQENEYGKYPKYYNTNNYN